jgi:hypothetical protein
MSRRNSENEEDEKDKEGTAVPRQNDIIGSYRVVEDIDLSDLCIVTSEQFHNDSKISKKYFSSIQKKFWTYKN